MAQSRKADVLRALAAVADTLLPSIAAPTDASVEEAAFYKWSGGSDPTLVEEILRFAKRNLSPDKYWAFTSVLWMLSTRLGTLFLAGCRCLSWKYPFILTFLELDAQAREHVFRGLATSAFNVSRTIFVSLKGITAMTLFSIHDPRSPWPAALGYSPDTSSKPLHPDTQRAEAVLTPAVTDLQEVGLQVDEEKLVPFLQSRGFRAAVPDADHQATTGAAVKAVIDCDAVVVGSGAGGSVTAATLAQAGLSVVVLEKSGWMKAADMTWQERQAWDSAYESGGLLASRDGAVVMLAGSTLGGGTKINWAGALRTPDDVRREWADKHGLPVFATDRFSSILDVVCERLRVTPGAAPHSRGNASLRAGLEAVGAEVQAYPRNCAAQDCAGSCTMGCRKGSKMSGDVTYLADAVQLGGRVLTSAYAHRVVRDRAGGRVLGLLISDGGSATSLPSQPSLRLFVKAPVVVSCGGSLHTPALLLRSGVRVHSNVGAHLRLHPAVSVSAAFPRAAPPTDYWHGAPMTLLSKHLSNREGSGYGSITITAAMQPGLFSSGMPWVSGARYKELLMAAPRFVSGLTVCRDTGSGRITIDAQGRPQFDYQVNKFDQESLLQGMELLVRAWAASGAEKIVVICEADLTYTVDETHTPEKLEAFLSRVRQHGARPHHLPVFTAHQMSSCRMGSSPKTSAIDPQGQVWGVEGLYVADASAMPTCSGTNPMITTYAVALLIAQNIAAKYGRPATRRGPLHVTYETACQAMDAANRCAGSQHRRRSRQHIMPQAVAVGCGHLPCTSGRISGPSGHFGCCGRCAVRPLLPAPHPVAAPPPPGVASQWSCSVKLQAAAAVPFGVHHSGWAGAAALVNRPLHMMNHVGSRLAPRGVTQRAGCMQLQLV